MTDETYNGWTNYETWVVKLWMDNDEGEYDYWREEAADVIRSSTGSQYQTREQAQRYDMAERLKDNHTERADELPEVNGTVFADLLSHALSKVNWYEIADALLADARELVTSDDDDEESEEEEE